MEDLIALLQGGAEIIEFLFQVLGQIIAAIFNSSALWDISDFINTAGQIAEDLNYFFTQYLPQASPGTRACWFSGFYLVAGLATGALSLHLHHDAYFRSNAFRMLTLGMGPILSGYLSWLAARLKQLLGAILQPAYYFWWAFSFSLGICLVRFGFCHHPGT
jgi:hypothetical protein